MKMKIKMKPTTATLTKEQLEMVEEFKKSKEAKILSGAVVSKKSPLKPMKRKSDRQRAEKMYECKPSLTFKDWADDVEQKTANFIKQTKAEFVRTASANRIDIQDDFINWRLCIIGIMDERFIITYYYDLKDPFIKSINFQHIQKHELISSVMFLINNRKEFQR